MISYNSLKGDCSRGKQKDYEKQIVRKGKLQAGYGLLELKDEFKLITKDLTKELIIEIELRHNVQKFMINILTNDITGVNGVELIVAGANNLKAVGYII